MATYRLACLEQPCLELAARLDDLVHRFEFRHGVRVTFDSKPDECGGAVPFALLIHDSANVLSGADLEDLRDAVLRVGVQCHDVMDLSSRVGAALG